MFPSLLVVIGLVAAVAVGGTEAEREEREELGAAPTPSNPQERSERELEVSDDAQHDTSPPLRSIPPQAPGPRRAGDEGLVRGEIHPHPKGDGIDPVDQGPARATSSSPLTPLAPTAPLTSVAASFDGPGVGMPGFTMTGAPPDTNSAVGPDHIVTTVNTMFAIQSKAGAVLYGPAAIKTIWSGFGGPCQNTNDGDPIVRYDVLADRFVISQFANIASTTGPYYECVAVSTGPSPTGSWYRYAFSYTTFPDFPKLGVWPDAYYVTYNMFNPNGSWVGPKACALDRVAMLAGQVATQQCVALNSSYIAPLPADVDSPTGPPAGAPNPMVSMGLTNSSLAYWSFKVDWATPANSTVSGPTSLGVASYSPACSGGVCISQPGTTNKLDSLADRLMNRLAYRNSGSTESLVVSHSATSGSNIGVRWYELRRAVNNALSVYQQGTYAVDATARWMPSVAMDKVGNIALGYSASSSSVYPSVRATGRLAGDALGTMSQQELTLMTGTGSQTGGLTRWGDYASMNIDPADQCTFWFSTEYLKSTGSFNWSTRIASFQLPGCAGPIADDFAVSLSPSTATVVSGSSTAATVQTSVQGNAQTVDLTVSGAPAGVTATISPTSVTAGDNATLSISTTSGAAAGTYPLTITGTGTSGTRTGTFSLVVAGTAPADSVVTNGNFEAGTSLTGWSKSGTVAAVTNPTPYSGAWSARAGSTLPTRGDSKLTTANFTVPSGKTTLSFWYRMNCPDSVLYDWATATLTDNSTRKTTTILPKTCTNNGNWALVQVPVIAGRSYKLALISHDDNLVADPTFTQFDQVRVT